MVGGRGHISLHPGVSVHMHVCVLARACARMCVDTVVAGTRSHPRAVCHLGLSCTFLQEEEEGSAITYEAKSSHFINYQ